MSASRSVPGEIRPVQLPLGPQSLIADRDAERAVLGALLLYGDPKRPLRLLDQGLEAKHFYWEQYGMVYGAILSLARRQLVSDSITTLAEMEKLGGKNPPTKEQLDDLVSYVPSVGNVAQYADRVIQLARWRERQQAVYTMAAAIEARDVETWEQTLREVAPQVAPQGVRARPRILRSVDEQGEVLEEHHYCESCDELTDQLAGAQTEIRGWRARYAKLRKEREEDARAGHMWPVAVQLFEIWKTATGHKRCPWTFDRYTTCEPFLKKYGPQVVERGIAGIAFDPYTKLRKNGTVQKFDSWETLFKTSGGFEEYANRAPTDWKQSRNWGADSSRESKGPARPISAERADGQQRLRVVDARGGG